MNRTPDVVSELESPGVSRKDDKEDTTEAGRWRCSAPVDHGDMDVDALDTDGVDVNSGVMFA